MRPPFEKASMEKESVVKCYYDARFLRLAFKDCASPTPLR